VPACSVGNIFRRGILHCGCLRAAGWLVIGIDDLDVVTQEIVAVV
jgi:hypothetical protein